MLEFCHGLFYCASFGFNLRKIGTFNNRLAYLGHTKSDNAVLQLSLLSNIHDIPLVYSSSIQLHVGMGFT